jgi:hypothetical protein
MRVIGIRFMLVCLLVVAGCSQVEEAADEEQSDRMLTALTTALDAWKNATPMNLNSSEPHIRFVDDDLAAGRKLLAYRLDNPGSVVVPFESVFVYLRLQTAEDKTIERLVGYQISLTPAVAVLRSEP